MTSEHLGMIRQIKNLILVKTDEHEDKKLAVRQMEHLICASVGIYHFMLFLIFWKYAVWAMVVVNIASIFSYILAYRCVSREKYNSFFHIVYTEILVHMILAIIMVGGECGFELYGFAILPLVYYNFYACLELKGANQAVKRRVLALLAVGVSIGIKIVSGFFEPVYTFGNGSVHYVMYLLNLSLIAVSVMVIQSIYISQILNMREALMEKNSMLDSLARTDELTGLNNRRAVMEFINLPIEKTGKYSVIMADIDDFKKINDTYGHDEGDKVLVSLAEIFRENARNSDIVCRWGGEEILVILMKCCLDDAQKIAEKIRNAINSEKLIQIDGTDAKVTMTFGIAYADYVGGQDVIKAADHNLYQGKNNGKNCIVAESD